MGTYVVKLPSNSFWNGSRSLSMCVCVGGCVSVFESGGVFVSICVYCTMEVGHEVPLLQLVLFDTAIH